MALTILWYQQKAVSDAIGSKAALNLTSVDLRSALLHAWKVGTDPWNSDHYPILIEYNNIIELSKCSKEASRLHNKDTDWTAFMEKVKRKNHEVKHIMDGTERGM
jgi:hypothetical protein